MPDFVIWSWSSLGDAANAPGVFAFPEVNFPAMPELLSILLIFDFGAQRILLEYPAEWCKVIQEFSF
ncbi:MAG: hypothetical protein Q8N89_04635 [Azonexus sp.]|nr:hypothetical protein [Azonexus sp.]